MVRLNLLLRIERRDACRAKITSKLKFQQKSDFFFEIPGKQTLVYFLGSVHQSDIWWISFHFGNLGLSLGNSPTMGADKNNLAQRGKKSALRKHFCQLRLGWTPFSSKKHRNEGKCDRKSVSIMAFPVDLIWFHSGKRRQSGSALGMGRIKSVLLRLN